MKIILYCEQTSCHHCPYAVVLYRLTVTLFWPWPSYNQRLEGPFPCRHDWRPAAAAHWLYGGFKYELTHHKTLWWISVLHQWNTVAWLQPGCMQYSSDANNSYHVTNLLSFYVSHAVCLSISITCTGVLTQEQKIRESIQSVKAGLGVTSFSCLVCFLTKSSLHK